MRKRKNTKAISSLAVFAAAVVLALLLYFASPAEKALPNDEGGAFTAGQAALTVHFIDVGQADCALAVCGGEAMLIDAGDNGTEQAVINYIRRLGLSRLDYVIASHPHADHIGGMTEVLSEFEAGTIIMPRISEELTPTSSTYEAFLNEVSLSSAEKLYSRAGMTFSLGSAQATVLAPVEANAEDLNDMSIVLRLDYGETSFLFTGDACAAEESDLLLSGADIDCDILKVGHHGSNTSSKKDFLAAVTPETAIIMCGEDNRYNHPHEKALSRLYAYTSGIYRTDICGDIVVACGETGYTVDY